MEQWRSFGCLFPGPLRRQREDGLKLRTNRVATMNGEAEVQSDPWSMIELASWRIIAKHIPAIVREP